MLRFAPALVLALSSAQALAHDARSAAVTVEVVGSAATVHLAVTQAGLHAALEAAAGHPLDPIDEGYGALVAEHLRTTLRLSADGEPLAVGDVGLRLGSHQSDARFLVELPPGTQALTLTADVLDGVEGHQLVARVRQQGEMTRAVLSDAEGRTVTVAVSEPVAPGAELSTEVPRPPRASVLWVLGLGALTVSLPLLVVVVRRSATSA